MYQALYRKYRPTNLEDVVGQNVIVKTLENSIKNNKVSHAYLFTGPRGTGKTSIAKAFAKIINCEKPNNYLPCGECVSCTQSQLKQNTDIIEIDAASNNGVDEIREIRNKVQLVPTFSKFKIYIIDEVHMLTTGAFNALLKTLEEPPSHAIFILATTEPHKIPNTILSRCQRFDFKRISNEQIVERLKYICKEEKIKYDELALNEIALLSDGGMRDSISLLDQVASYIDNDEITVTDVHEVSGTLSFQKLNEMTTLIFNKDLEKTLFFLNECNKNGVNIKKLTEQLMMFFENIIMSREAPEYYKENVNYNIDLTQYSNIDNKKIISCIEVLNEVTSKFNISSNLKMLLELSLIQIIELLKEEPLKQVEFKEIREEIVIPKKTKEEILLEYEVISEEQLMKFKEQRINNTLSSLDKKEIINVKNKLEKLKSKCVDKTYGKYISLFFDGQIKAASKECFIVIFDEKSTSEYFNENIPLLEKILKNFEIDNIKIISTYVDDWNIIKTEFNSKQKQYIYDLAIIPETDVYKEKKIKTNEIQDVFSDCIEYV